jgi:hypothetical protein
MYSEWCQTILFVPHTEKVDKVSICMCIVGALTKTKKYAIHVNNGNIFVFFFLQHLFNLSGPLDKL